MIWTKRIVFVSLFATFSIPTFTSTSLADESGIDWSANTNITWAFSP